MPVLEREIDLYPNDLLDRAADALECSSGEIASDWNGHHWWAIYTRSRHEKQLMRKLRSMDVPFYGAVIERRYRSHSGRLRRMFEPLFSNYVFIFGDDDCRQMALTSNCISRCCPVFDGYRFTLDLQNLHRLISTGAPLTPERRIVRGDKVRIRTGPFTGFEGLVLRRQGETRLLVCVDFMRQGASVLLDDCEVDVF